MKEFLRRVIRLNDYIEDRVFTEINNLGNCVDNFSEDLQNLEVSIEDRAYEYDLESLRENVIELEQKIEELEDKLKSLEEA
jgi:chromosome segregation ATPase